MVTGPGVLQLAVLQAKNCGGLGGIEVCIEKPFLFLVT